MMVDPDVLLSDLYNRDKVFTLCFTCGLAESEICKALNNEKFALKETWKKKMSDVVKEKDEGEEDEVVVIS